MKRLLLSLFVLGVCTPVSAQVEDTTSAWRYLALDVGNVWEYERWEDVCLPEIWPPICEPEPNGFLRRSVTGETVIGDTTFFVIEDAFFSESEQPTGASEVLVRFDTTEARAYEHRLDGELRYGWPDGFPCPLDLPFGLAEPESCEFEGGIVDSWEQTIDAETFTIKFFNMRYGGYAFAPDLGVVHVIRGKYVTDGYDMVYARINGVEYGAEQFPVATETTPDAGALALSVYPNPSSGHATVRLSLDAPQRTTLAVYDVLARRVLTDDLGALPAGERTYRLDLGALPPGLYVVRLTGNAGVAATARLVVQ